MDPHFRHDSQYNNNNNLVGTLHGIMSKKADENLKDKIKSLFRLNKDKGTPVQYQRAPLKDFVFTPEILKVMCHLTITIYRNK